MCFEGPFIREPPRGGIRKPPTDPNTIPPGPLQMKPVWGTIEWDQISQHYLTDTKNQSIFQSTTFQ